MYLFSRRMAESKAPAAACWAARLPFCSHRCAAETPGVGAAKTAASAACTGGWTTSGGSSRSCKPCAQHQRTPC